MSHPAAGTVTMNYQRYKAMREELAAAHAQLAQHAALVAGLQRLVKAQDRYIVMQKTAALGSYRKPGPIIDELDKARRKVAALAVQPAEREASE